MVFVVVLETVVDGGLVIPSVVVSVVCHDVVVVSSVVRLVLLLLMNHTKVSVWMSSMTHRWTHRTRRNSTRN